MIKKNKKVNFINNFPIITIIVVAIIILILVMMYLTIKPYKTINKDGYMILSNNMTYNLVSNTMASTDELDIGVTSVSSGDYVYKQLNTYYVGVEKKKEVEYDYPIYSSDGLTIYNINEDVVLIDRNFEKLKGYSGLSLNHGILYNDGDEERADDIDYLFLNLNNSIYINAQTITIKTINNEYLIPVNSPTYFDSKYINYYTFNGEVFIYNRINDIYYDSLIEIGNLTFTYSEFLSQMGLNDIDTLETGEDKTDEENTEIEEENLKNEENNEVEEGTINQYIKPEVKISNINSSVYSITGELSIKDPSGVITSNPMFEIYTPDGKLYLRKKFSSYGKIKIAGLYSNTEYKVVGTYKYKNESGVVIVSTFYEETVTTKDSGLLDAIELYSEIGDIYSNKIEIKDLRILNNNLEAISGINKIALDIESIEDGTKRTVNLSYVEIRSLVNGEKITITSKNNLTSDSVYKYTIKIYDKEGNEIKCSGNVSGIIKTAKATPKIDIESSINNNNEVSIKIKTENSDNIYIKNYKYELYSYSGFLVDEGELDYKNQSIENLYYDDLDYNVNYILRITGIYDIEDGKGEKNFNVEKDFTTANLNSNFTAWYDQKNTNITYNSLTTDIYISSNTKVLEKDTTEVMIYLTDANGNDILDENGNLKYLKKFTKEEYSSSECGTDYCFKDINFKNLNSKTNYYIKIKIKVEQLENNKYLQKTLTPSIKTLEEDAYIEVVTKKLIGDKLDVKLKIQDPDDLIDSKKVIVEIYKTTLSTGEEINSIEDINERYIYRNEYDISKEISLNFDGYSENSYTIVVFSDSYKGGQVKYYLNVKSDNQENNLIKVHKTIKATLEMYEQRLNQDKTKYNTKVSFNYELGENITNLYLVDCYIEENKTYRTCTNLGYFNQNKEWTVLSDRVSGLSTNGDDETKTILTFSNEINTGDHTFYLLVEKSGNDFSDIYGFNESSTQISSYFYIVSSLEYNADHEIYNINHASDFFELDMQSLIKSKEKKHFVVTKNIDFTGNYIITGAKFANFYGVIDFQGYSVELYQDDSSKFNLFSNNYGTFKNVVFNYHMNYTGVEKSEIKGFIANNMRTGIIENVIVNVEQTNINGRGKGISLLAYYNYGTIDNFVVNVNSDIHAFSNSSLITYINYEDGVISNGYITNLNGSKIILYDGSYHGTFANENNGIVRNVYNLVNIISENDSYPSSGIGTIVRHNKTTAIVENCFSVATTTQSSAATKPGPNIHANSGSVSNNFYVDTNTYNSNYNNSYNTKISTAALMNNNFINIVLNSDQAFSLTNGYYPLLKMNDFMKDKQTLIKILFNYYSEIKLDVLSSEVIYNNENNDHARAKIYISNPNKLEITNIEIVDLTVTIDKEATLYNESSQVTELVVDLSLTENDIAKTNYEIKSVTYKDPLNGPMVKEYSENHLRRLDIDMYRNINLYNDLVTYINRNENIFITQNITVPSGNLSLPENKTYSAILNGNEKTLNFDGKEISRGYFIYSLTGTLKNFQIANLTVNSTDNYIGFIRTSTNASIENIDMKDVSLILNKDASISTLYLGSIASYTKSTLIDRVSVNNLEIKKDENYNGTIKIYYMGGIVGYLDSSQIENSYVYNLNMNNLYSDLGYGREAIGGIGGYLSSSTIKNCYSTGKIDTEFSNVGGIAGLDYKSYIKNNYSYMKIKSSGDYIGGIVGQITPQYGYTVDSIQYNLFIGSIINTSVSSQYSLITPLANAGVVNNNYTITDDHYITNEKVIEKTKVIQNNEEISFYNFSVFDIEGAFIDNPDIEDLPYLNQSSFVEQKIINDTYSDLSESSVKYSIRYDNVSGGLVSNQIKDVNNQDKYISSDLYENALATYIYMDLIDDTTYKILASNNDEFVVSEEVINSNLEYKLTPKEYKTGYVIKVSDINGNIVEEIDLNISFYRKVENQDDWNSISSDKAENVILIENIELDKDSATQKNINNLLGNGKTITLTETYTNNLIENVSGIMRDVNFKGIEGEVSFENTGEAAEYYFGLLRYNNGKIENCSFKDIALISEKNVVGIIGVSNGFINNINLSNITVSGTGWVGGLVAYDETNIYNRTHITNVKASNITLYGTKCIGGIAGRVTYRMEGIEATNVEINPAEISNNNDKSYIGGIAGVGDCTNCSIKDSTITTSGSYIGGISGQASEVTLSQAYLEVSNVKILDSGAGASTYVGGMYGYTYYINSSKVDNLIIGAKNGEDEDGNQLYTNFNANRVGGIVGESVAINNSYVNNSTILGKNYVGGISGTGWNGNMNNNVVVDSTISASENTAGGIIAYSGISSNAVSINGTIVANSTITSQTMSGGIVGKFNNKSTASQIVGISNNLSVGNTISADDTNGGVAGGIIGDLYQVPSSSTILFNSSLFYGDVKTACADGDYCTLVGNIEHNDTGASSGYGTESLSNYGLSNLSNFKEYKNGNLDYQIDSISELNAFINNSTFKTYFTTSSEKNGKYYFPNRKSSPKLSDTELVEIPYDYSIGYQETSTLLMMSRTLRNYSSSYNNSLNIDYDIYSSGVNKVNIEFSGIDSNIYFYYEVGDYKSTYIPINNRTYTLTYDYKNPIKIYITNGYNYKEVTIKATDIAKTVNLIDEKVYYITDKKLYSEDKMIVGNFVNLYGNEALTSDGNIYNIITKQVSSANVDYSLFEISSPLYEFDYKGTNIETYYNYSTVDGVIKDFQLFVKNGNLNSISSTLENKKNMYIIDYYNNNEIQIILKDDGKLYSLKHNIKYPSDLINKSIKELYMDINSSSTVAVLKYEDNSIYSFDYRTGKLIFTNSSSEYTTFLEYVKDKLSGSSESNKIENISGYDNYAEIEMLKTKIYDISLEEASDKIYNSNNSETTNDNYISVYNDITQNYDIYKISNILNNSIELESETDKMYKNYELVQFYKTLGKNKNKMSVSGIIIFAISIILIMFTLFLLIRHRKIRRGEA